MTTRMSPLVRNLSSFDDIGRGRIFTILEPLILRLWDFHGRRFTAIYLTITVRLNYRATHNNMYKYG